jgi:hypothetical protein
MAMESAARIETARPELVTDRPIAGISPCALKVAARFVLSEDGRKLSLLSGGNGRAMQEIDIDVPAHRLHLVRVGGNGVALLKLRPRFELDGVQRVVRIDAVPMYDIPPTIEQLLNDAARNHELERAYLGERSLARAARREHDREFRVAVAQEFLREPERRALVHPAPSPRRCFVATDRGRVRFDIITDSGPAHDVPLEAYKRFTADLKKRRERTTQERSAQLAIHEQKRRAVAQWVAEHGTDDQRARQAAGVLPMQEVIDAMADEAFRALDDRPRYAHDGAERLQAFLRQSARFTNAVVTPDDLVAVGKPAITATRLQWAFMEGIRAQVPDANVTLRKYDLSWARDSRASKLVACSVIVVKRIGVISVRREFAAPVANEVSDVA